MKLANIASTTVCGAIAIVGVAIAQPSQVRGVLQLHDALDLRPDQERAWQVFQRATAPDPGLETRRRDALKSMENMRAPQRMDLSLQLMRGDLQDMERRSDALKSFYEELSPAQQATFDRQTLPRPEQYPNR